MAEQHLPKPKIKKRKYSRKGCKECKRRKIKCDESTPACDNCSRLNKICVYDQQPRFAHEDFEPTIGEAPESGPKGSLKPKPLQMRFYDHDMHLKPLHAPAPMPLEYGSVYNGDTHNLRPDPFVTNGSNGSNGPSGSNDTSPILKNDGMTLLSAANGPGVPLQPQSAVDTQMFTLREPPMTMSPGALTNDDMQMLFDEASELVRDMNHLIAPDMTESFMGPPPMLATNSDTLGHHIPTESIASTLSTGSEERNQFQVDDFSAQIHEDAYVSPNGIGEHLLLSNLELIDRCIQENSLVEPHVTYLKTVTNTDISYHLFPFASLIEQNEVVKLLLTYSAFCPYLLTSLLAISATFQFNQTGKLLHDRARQKYVAVCLKSLRDAFTEHSGFKNSAIFSSNIEKLLLTVLVLTSYFTATTCMLNDNLLWSWKAHLRGARDLLKNYSKIANSTFEDLSIFMSGGLALAKCWFFAIESSAALHSSIGGALLISAKPADSPTLTDEEIYGNKPKQTLESEQSLFTDTGIFEYEVHPQYHDALMRVNMLCLSSTLSEFNLYWGYTSKFVRVILLFCSVMETLRLNNLKKAPHRWISHLVALNDGAVSDIIVPQVLLKTFIVPRTSNGHPEYVGPDKITYPSANWASDLNEEGERNYYSWFDATQQLHSDSIFLRILTSDFFMQLPRTSLQVQELVRKIFDGSFFILSKSLPRYLKSQDTIVVESDKFYLSLRTFDIRCIMIQSVYRLLSGIVVEDDDFEKIELYFMGLVKLGNGSSLNSLDTLTRFKEKRNFNKENNPGQVDDEIYDYYERAVDIPFA